MAADGLVPDRCQSTGHHDEWGRPAKEAGWCTLEVCANVDINLLIWELRFELKSLELKFELKSLELELELKIIMSCGIGIEVEIKRIGIGA